MKIIENLEQIGLTQKQAAAYTALLRMEQAGATQVAKESGLERTTIYKVLGELESKGLVVASKHGSRQTYTAEPPSRLRFLLKQRESILEEMLPLLTALQGTKKNRPAVRLYESIEGIKQVYNDSLYAEEKLRRDFMSLDSMADLLGVRFIQNHVNERVKRGVRVHSIRCQSTSENANWFFKSDNKELNREVRFLDRSLTFAPLIMIYDNKVAVITSKEESLAMVVESKELSQAMKIMFDIGWANSQ